MKIPWYKQKTTLTGLLSIAGVGIGLVTGTLPAMAALQMGVPALLAIFLRQGVEKAKNGK
jgi:hypothetical protein